MNTTAEKLYMDAIFYISSFLTLDEQCVRVYLKDNWYHNETWKLWGSRHKRRNLLTITTMMVESHWPLLICLYLLPCNRPRLDLVLYIAEKRLFSKCKSDLQQLASGVKKPHWCKSFVFLGRRRYGPSKRMSTWLKKISLDPVQPGFKINSLYVSTLLTTRRFHPKDKLQSDAHRLL